MPKAPFGELLQYLHKMYPPDDASNTDAELLDRFVAQRDQDAFAVLVHRHASMVLGLCQRLLGDHHLAEDAFQATFIILARRAAAIRSRTSLGTWLYATAQRVAVRAKAKVAASRNRERESGNMRRAEQLDEHTLQELRSIIDEEIGRLPEKYQAPLVLCYLEGKSHERAAQELGCAKGSLERRLSRGCELLRQQLIGRGVTLSAGVLATALCEKVMGARVAASLTIKTVKAVHSLMSGKAIASGCATAQVLALAEEAMVGMTAIKGKLVVMVLALSLAIGGAGWASFRALDDQIQPAKKAQVPDVEIETVKHEADDPTKNGPPIINDRFGDPLPEGAIRRFGTTRLRHSGFVHGVAFSADGKILVSGGSDHMIRIWDSTTGKELRQLQGHTHTVLGVSVSKDGRILASAGNDGTVRIWDAAAGKDVRRLQVQDGGAIFSVAISPDGKTLASGGSGDGPLALWNLSTGKEFFRPKATGTVEAVAFSPDGKTLASGHDSAVKLWDVATGKEVQKLGKHRGPVSGVAFSPDGKQLASSSRDFTICVWDPMSGKRLRTIQVPVTERSLLRMKDGGFKEPYPGGVFAIAYSTDSKTLASGDYEGVVRLWDPSDGKELGTLRGHSREVHTVVFSPDGKTLASGSYDFTVRLWDVAARRELLPFQSHAGGISRVAISADGKMAASVSSDRTVRNWDLATGEARHVFHGHTKWLSSVVISPDGKMLASAGEDHEIRLWDASSGKELRQLHGHEAAVITSLAFSPNGKTLVSTSYDNREKDNSMRFWDPATGKELRRINEEHTKGKDLAGFHRIQFSPDGTMIGASGRKIHVWDAATGKEIRHFAIWGSFAFSPDGKTFVTRDYDGKFRLWDLAKDKERYQFESLNFSVQALVVFSPDGKTLVREGENYRDRTVRFYEIASGKERHRLTGHRGFVTSAAFTPDGKTLLTGSEDATALLWDLSAVGRVGAAQATPNTLKRLWNDLAGEDAAKAYQAIWSMYRLSRQAVPFLKQQLRPVAPVDAKRLALLIGDIDHARFEKRQHAVDELEKLAELAESALQKALTKETTLEARRRIEKLLEKLSGPISAPDQLQKHRAIEVLEHIGTPESRALLESLASGASEARLTLEAKASLERLAR